MGLLRWIGGKLLALGRLILPMLGRAAGSLWSRTAFWIAHAVLIVAVLAGLGWLNHHWDLPRYLRAPTGWLAQVWLPALFLVFYLNLWLGYWLWVLVRPGSAPSPCPDIDAAWAEVVSALDRAGLDLTRVPLFLVLGRPRSGAGPMFRASGLTLNPMGSTDPKAVRAYAGPLGVFILASDCCLMGGLAEWAAQRPEAPADPRSRVSPGTPTPPRSDSIPSLTAPVGELPEPATPTEPLPPPLTKNPTELDRLTARFRHLCGLIVQTRRPYAPVNGILALVPEICTRQESEAGLAALLLGRDCRVATEELQLHCPVVGMVCDAEQLPGFSDFLRKLPADRRGQRFGRRLPYAPRLAPTERAKLVEDSVRWVCRELVPRLTYRVAPLKLAALEDGEDLVFLSAELFRRQDVLARLFSQAFGSEEFGPVWAGGCYLAGTGPGADQSGFLTDVFSQLLESQNLLAWTPAARASDAALRRRIVAGYGLVVAIVLATLGLGVMTLWR